MTVSIPDEIKKLDQAGLLPQLLFDQTTKRNLLLATDGYKEAYGLSSTDRLSLVFLREHPDAIMPRALKPREIQKKRSKKKAEIFTPIRIVKQMVDMIDQQYFNDRIEYPDGEGAPTTLEIDLDDLQYRKLLPDYMSKTWLEITCGEAPYIVTRYDTETGEMIPVRERVGFLDIKLRIAGEIAETYGDWMIMVSDAYKSAYGYEYQGDSLLIARINLIMTLFEYQQEYWPEAEMDGFAADIAKVISWNVFQMDGLKNTIPGMDTYAETMDWQNKCPVTIQSMQEEDDGRD